MKSAFPSAATDAVVDIDTWLAQAFAPGRREHTVAAMADQCQTERTKPAIDRGKK